MSSFSRPNFGISRPTQPMSRFSRPSFGMSRLSRLMSTARLMSRHSRLKLSTRLCNLGSNPDAERPSKSGHESGTSTRYTYLPFLRRVTALSYFSLYVSMMLSHLCFFSALSLSSCLASCALAASRLLSASACISRNFPNSSLFSSISAYTHKHTNMHSHSTLFNTHCTLLSHNYHRERIHFKSVEKTAR